ncbi:MAG TPA: hypothetical protein VIK31_01025 [Propionibacteriaceae bacterium]
MTEIRRAPQPVAIAAAVVPSARPRRVLVGVVLAPLAWLGLTSAGGGLTYAPLVWMVLVGVASVLGAASLATYIPGPGSGRTPVWGCGPCAVVAVTSLPFAAVMLHANPGQISTAGMAALVTGLGLFQRLRDPKACPTRPAADR